jgi:hypothetical protein
MGPLLLCNPNSPTAHLQNLQPSKFIHACVWEKCLLHGSQVLGTMKDSELDGNVHCMQKNKIINRAKKTSWQLYLPSAPRRNSDEKKLLQWLGERFAKEML